MSSRWHTHSYVHSRARKGSSKKSSFRKVRRWSSKSICSDSSTSSGGIVAFVAVGEAVRVSSCCSLILAGSEPPRAGGERVTRIDSASHDHGQVKRRGRSGTCCCTTFLTLYGSNELHVASMTLPDCALLSSRLETRMTRQVSRGGIADAPTSTLPSRPCLLFSFLSFGSLDYTRQTILPSNCLGSRLGSTTIPAQGTDSRPALVMVFGLSRDSGRNPYFARHIALYCESTDSAMTPFANPDNQGRESRSQYGNAAHSTSTGCTSRNMSQAS